MEEFLHGWFAHLYDKPFLHNLGTVLSRVLALLRQNLLQTIHQETTRESYSRTAPTDNAPGIHVWESTDFIAG